jgi:hypothetical protein
MEDSPIACELQFPFASDEAAFPTATFQTIKQKKSYVEAEFANRACIRAWDEHRKSQTKLERKRTSYQLAKTRYNFYQKWLLKNRPPADIIPFPTNSA